MMLILEERVSSAKELLQYMRYESKEIHVVSNEAELTAIIQKDDNHTIEMVFLQDVPDRIFLCDRIRRISQVPLFVVCRQGSTADALQCLNAGADDYMSGDYLTPELPARINAILRRSLMQYPRVPTVAIGNNVIDFQRATVTRAGKEVNLTSMEYKLLLVLIRHKNNVLTRMEILDILYNDLGEYVNDNTLTVYIKRLRAKMADEKGEYIRTIRGVGYSLGDRIQ